jgi:hypothetical protein
VSSCHEKKLKLGLTVATYTARNVKEAIVSPVVGILSQAVGFVLVRVAGM